MSAIFSSVNHRRTTSSPTNEKQFHAIFTSVASLLRTVGLFRDLSLDSRARLFFVVAFVVVVCFVFVFLPILLLTLKNKQTDFKLLPACGGISTHLVSFVQSQTCRIVWQY